MNVLSASIIKDCIEKTEGKVIIVNNRGEILMIAGMKGGKLAFSNE
jgi:hypothetical protein